MSRLMVSDLVTAIGVATDAHADSMPQSSTPSPGYFTEGGVLRVAPANPNKPSDRTACPPSFCIEE
jgi:hypothetical protein